MMEGGALEYNVVVPPLTGAGKVWKGCGKGRGMGYVSRSLEANLLSASGAKNREWRSLNTTSIPYLKDQVGSHSRNSSDPPWRLHSLLTDMNGHFKFGSFGKSTAHL